VDLLLLEFAVNDGGVCTADNQRLQAMKSLSRKARRANSAVDILVLYLADADKMSAYRDRREPLVITHHEQVMAHYGIPVLNLALDMSRRIETGRFVWSDFSGDSCHPSHSGTSSVWNASAPSSCPSGQTRRARRHWQRIRSRHRCFRIIWLRPA